VTATVGSVVGVRDAHHRHLEVDGDLRQCQARRTSADGRGRRHDQGLGRVTVRNPRLVSSSLDRGFHYYSWMVLTLAVDIGLNIDVRVARARKRRRLGLSRAERLWHNGVGPRPQT